MDVSYELLERIAITMAQAQGVVRTTERLNRFGIEQYDRDLKELLHALHRERCRVALGLPEKTLTEASPSVWWAWLRRFAGRWSKPTA